MRFFVPLSADFMLIICFYPPLRQIRLTAETRLVPHLQHKPFSFFRKAFSLPTAKQILRADRGQPLFVDLSPALISAISFFISAISNLSFSSHSSRVVAYMFFAIRFPFTRERTCPTKRNIRSPISILPPARRLLTPRHQFFLIIF